MLATLVVMPTPSPRPIGSGGSVSFADVATWVGFAAGVIYILEFIAVRVVPQLRRLLRGTSYPWLAHVGGNLGVIGAFFAFFGTNFNLRVLGASVAVVGIVTANVMEYRTWRRALRQAQPESRDDFAAPNAGLYVTVEQNNTHRYGFQALILDLQLRVRNTSKKRKLIGAVEWHGGPPSLTAVDHAVNGEVDRLSKSRNRPTWVEPEATELIWVTSARAFNPAGGVPAFRVGLRDEAGTTHYVDVPEVPDHIPPPPRRPSTLGSTASLTMLQSRPNSRVHTVRFDTGVRPSQRIPCPWQASAIRLVKPAPHDPTQLIRATDPLPAQAHFGDRGRFIVHGFAPDGIDVEVQPYDRVFEVEAEVFELAKS